MQVELDRADTDLNLVEMARELPREFGYLPEDFDPRARVTIRGITYCANSERPLGQFINGVELCVAKYLAQERMTKSELRAAINGDEKDVRRLFVLLEREGYFLSDGDGPDGEWTRVISRSAREFRKVHSVPEYIAKLDELASRKSPLVVALDRAVEATAQAMDRSTRAPADQRVDSTLDQSVATERYDAFIAHATADKDEVARPLAEELQRRGYRIWYDEWTLKIGDSLGRKIDAGLASSRYGVVVLSPSFFARTWPKKELDGLEAREAHGTKVILPVWHRLGAEEVGAHSPMLAGRVAARTRDGIDHVADLVAEELGIAGPASIGSDATRLEPSTSVRAEVYRRVAALLESIWRMRGVVLFLRWTVAPLLAVVVIGQPQVADRLVLPLIIGVVAGVVLALLRVLFWPISGAAGRMKLLRELRWLAQIAAVLVVVSGVLISGISVGVLPPIGGPPSVAPSCVATLDAVTVYVDPELRGECRGFGVGEHELAGFAGRVSSVFDPAGAFSWVLYDASGRPGRFDQTMTLLPSDWNDLAVRIKVERHSSQ